MIKTLKYQESLDHRYVHSDAVKVYIFKAVNLPCCWKWENEVLFPTVEKYNMFEWYQIFIDQNSIPFPPPVKPIFYFVIPDGGLLFTRHGEVELEKLDNECAKFLKIQNGMYYAEALEI
jgi:hypothetical protein